MRDGVKARRILRDGGYNGTFGKGQSINLFIEVTSCSNLDSECVGTKVYGVQVLGDNALLKLFLRHVRLILKLEGQILLLKLTDILFKGTLIETAAENIILDKLLGNG